MLHGTMYLPQSVMAELVLRVWVEPSNQKCFSRFHLAEVR